VARNDRKPGRDVPVGCASWVAHATPAWTEEHLEDDSASVLKALQTALSRQLPGCEKGGAKINWLHTGVHRWRYAQPAQLSVDECWWDAALSLGVCGDFMGAGNVEAAWRSGDELADTVAALMDEEAVMKNTQNMQDTASA
jgi:renalase